MLDADSWATDCHKWLNAPYDSGIALVREAKHLHNAMKFSARYCISVPRESLHFIRPKWDDACAVPMFGRR